jgi:hypothetical protein
MSLPIYQRVAVTDTGDVIPGAEYTVINENTGVAAPIYSDRTGATLLTAPYFADSVGTIQFFIAQGTTFRVAASGGVGTYTDRYVYGVAAAVLALADGSATINRVGSDGSALSIQKDGTTVGSWQSRAGLVSTIILDPRAGGMGLTGGGAGFNATNHLGAQADGLVDVGSANYRFKDLYLSGGVYLGGTAAANKLDDYEEGLWTPTGAGVSPVYNCFYTKIGNKVHCKGYFNTTASVGTVGGLPFTFFGGTGSRSIGTTGFNNFTSSAMSLLHTGTGTAFSFYVGGTSQTITTGKIVYFDLTYFTND